MKKSVKAALLSAFVYPGMGHFYLKKHAMFAVFACAFSVPLYFIISEIMAKAENIVEQINNGEIPLDIAAISQSLSSSAVGVDAQVTQAYSLGVVDTAKNVEDSREYPDTP